MLECVGRRAIEHTAERDLKLHLFKQNNNEAFAGQGRADRTEAATSAVQFRKIKGVTHLPKKLRSSLKLAALELGGGCQQRGRREARRAVARARLPRGSGFEAYAALLTRLRPSTKCSTTTVNEQFDNNDINTLVRTR